MAINIGQYRVPRGAHHGLELGLNALIRFFLQLDTRGHKIIFAFSFPTSFVNSGSMLRENLLRTKFMFERQLRNGARGNELSNDRLSLEITKFMFRRQLKNGTKEKKRATIV